MFKPGLITAAVLTMLLSACGGGESTVTGDSTGTDTGGTDTGGTDTGGTDTGGTTTNVSEGLGAGTGSEHKPGELTLSASTILTGGSVNVTANGVDKNDSNNALTNSSYQYTFSSVCASANPATASLTTTSTFSVSGEASTFYVNNSCAGTDTITAQLFNQTDDVSVATPLATATATLQATAPQLGFGSGVDYRDGKIDGELYLVGVTETVLTANAVDPLNLNALVTSDNYIVTWSSPECSSDSFSISSQSLSTPTIQTRYEAGSTNDHDSNPETDPEGCDSKRPVKLILSLASDPDTVLDTVEETLELIPGDGNTITEAIGYSSGADFVRGGLDTGGKYSVLVGQSITVSASAVNLSDNNALLNDSYQFVFSSDCSTDGKAEFSVESTFTATGEVSTVYSNIGCEIGDEITATLKDSQAKSINDSSGNPIEATVTVDTAKPLLGSGSGASFIEASEMDAIELNGATETTISLNLVDPLNSNTVVADSNYIIQWASDYASLSDGGTPAESCETGEFSITKQDFESGTISTRYTTDLSAACTNTHTITPWLSLRGANDCPPSAETPNSDCINVSEDLSTSKDTLSIEIALGVDPKLGRIDDGSFTQGNVYLVSDTIPGGGSTALRVDIVDGNQSDEQVTNRAYGLVATSECLEQLPSLASFTAVEKITSKGFDTFTYNAEGCEGEDEITISLYDVVDGNMDVTELLDSATVTVTVEAVELGSIAYNSATAEAISISTIGDPVLPKQTRLTFTVTDEYGEVMEDQIVVFELTNITASGSDSDLSLAQITDVTNAEGQVTAIVNAGTRHTVFAVLAKILEDGADPEDYQPGEVLIQTTSQPISVTTGIPDQDSFDLSADVFNPGAYDVNGTVVNVTAYAADQYQNPVPDGTIVNFTAESGIITSYCTTSAGACSVTWSSSGTRPGEYDSALERVNEIDPQTNPFNGDDETDKTDGIKGVNGKALEDMTSVLGMTTITAYTVGEAGYTDTDGDGRFDVFYEVVSEKKSDRNGDGIDDADVNSDGYVDVDQDGDGSPDVDLNGDGIYDLDLNEDGDLDRDENSDEFVDLDENDDGLIDVNLNDDEFIDIDLNEDGIVDIDVDGDKFIDVDANGDGYPDKDVNDDGNVDVDFNLDGLPDVDENVDGYIDEDDDADGEIDPVDVNSVLLQPVVPFLDEVVFESTTFVAFEIKAPVIYVGPNSALYEPHVLFGEAVRDDDWSDNGDLNATPDDNGRGQRVEFFADFNENGSFDSAPDSGYQGVMCTESAVNLGDGHCSSLMHVRDSVRIIQSVSGTALTIRIWAYDRTDENGVDIFTEDAGDAYKLDISSGSFYVLLQDANGNMPPKDSSLTASGTGYDVSGDGTVSNGLGYLYSDGASRYPTLENLPSFGELFLISYTAEDEAEKIEISATTGIIETSPRVLTLPSANP